MSDQLIFITTNQSKFKDLARRLNEVEIVIKQKAVELDEGRSFNVEEVAELKLLQAKKLFPKRKIFVEDRGFLVPSLKNFPGPFVKLILKSIGIDGILKLMENKYDRTAKFVSVLAYFDGSKDFFFKEEEIGFIAHKKRGQNDRNWGDLLYIYGHPIYPNKTLAELDNDEWNKYLNEIEKTDYIRKFISHLVF